MYRVDIKDIKKRNKLDKFGRIPKQTHTTTSHIVFTDRKEIMDDDTLPVHPLLNMDEVVAAMHRLNYEEADNIADVSHQHMRNLINGVKSYHGRLLSTIKFDGRNVGLPVMNLYASNRYFYRGKGDDSDDDTSSAPVSTPICLPTIL